MDWDIKKLVNDPDWQALPYEERFKAIKEVDPDFAALPATERFKGIQELRGEVTGIPLKESLAKPREQLLHEHNINRGLEAEAQFEPIKVKAKMIAEVPRLVGMLGGGVFGGTVGGGLGETAAEEIEKAGGAREELSPLAIGTQAAIPAVTSGAVKAIGYAAKEVAPAAARRIVQSILKPTEGDLKFGKEPVNAFLEEKFAGSLPKVRADVVARKKALLNEVQDKLAESNETTPRSQVLDILENEKGRIASEVGTTNDKALNRGIDTIKRKIEANYPEELSQSELHKLRKEIDSSIPKFTSEAVEQGLNNVRYNLRSGINDILEANNPGIAKSNARVSELIDIDRMLGNRVRQAGNAPLLPHTFTDLALLPARALGSPAVLTRAAKVLNTFAPKPGLAGAIGSIGAAPVVAPRQPGLAGALSRTKPAEPFKGDIHSAVTQAAPAGPAAATVRSPQPAGGLAEAIGGLENIPEVPPPANLPPGFQQNPGLAAIIDELVRRHQIPRSSLESTPTIMSSR